MRRYFVQKFFSYPQQSKAALLSPASGKVLQLYAAHLTNRSGGLADLALLKKFGSAAWELGTVSDASTPDLSDQTASIQSGGTVDVFTTTNNDGFIVQSLKPFNMIGLTISQAQTGSPVYAIEYYNGTSFTDAPMLATPDLTSTGDKVYLFAPPSDWAVGGSAGVGVDASMYAIRIRATTAGGQAVQATAAWVAEIMMYQDDVASNGSLGISFPYEFPERLEANEEIIPYFSVASTDNLVTVRYFQEA